MKTRRGRAKTRLLCLVLGLLLAGGLNGCGSGKSKEIKNVSQLDQAGYTIAVDPGSASALTAAERFPNAEIMYCNGLSNACLTVSQGKADAFVYGKLYLQYAVASEALEDLAILGEPIDQCDIAAGIAPARSDLLPRINDFIRQIKADGTLEDMYDRWVVRADRTMPEIQGPEAPEMTLRFGTSGLVEPMNYFDENQELTGFDVEFIRRLAAYLNADVKLEAMSFDALVASLQSGRLDVVISDLNVTEERKEVILMSDPYMTSDTSVLVKADRLPDADRSITSLDQLADKRLGLLEGSSFDPVMRAIFPQAEIMLFPTEADCIVAMQSGKVDCCIVDEPVAKVQMASVDGLKCLPGYLSEDNYAFVLNLDNTALAEQLNGVLAELSREGVTEALQKKWFNLDKTQQIQHASAPDTSKGTLRVITNFQSEPFCFVSAGETVGYDVELITLAAERLGYGVDIQGADFSTLIPSIAAGKADIAVGGITVTEERAKSVRFTDPVYRGGTVALVRADTVTGAGFLERIQTSFRRTFITENRWRIVLNGLLVTVRIALASLVLGTLLGFVVSFPLRSGNKWIKKLSDAISTVLSGLPLLVILMVLYYIIFKSVNISAVWVGIIGFTIDFANTVAGLLNTGVLAVDPGQQEAASAMGYNNWQVFCKITLPQAAHQMFGQYQGAVVGMVKSTSIVGYIAVEDLTKAGDIIRSRTYEAFFPLIATAVLYFAISALFVFLLGKVSVRLDAKRRPRRVRGVVSRD